MNEIDLLRAALQFSGSVVIIGSSVRDDRGRLLDFRIQFLNRNPEKTVGQLATELSDQLLLISADTTSLSIIWTQALEVVETGLTYEADHALRLQSGESRWFSVSISRYQDGVCAIFTDITARKQTEQSLQKKIDELHRSNQNLEQFAYVASHDLQEPLRKLVGFGDILQSQYGSRLNESGMKLVLRMQLATQRMHTLINDLLGFSRITSAQEVFVSVDLHAIVDTVLSDLEVVIREKRAVLAITSLPFVDGDAGQLGQLFQNLLSNALKFTRTGEIPSIRIDCKVILGSAIQPMPGTSVLTSDLNRSFFAITVSDNGIGFEEKYLNRIFTIFQRLHNRTDYPGTGIGLAVVVKVIENHNGYLNAHSQPGQGADFTVYLPGKPARLKMGNV